IHHIVDGQFVGSGNPGHEVLLANHENAFGKPLNLGPILLHALDYDGSGGASVHLKFGEAVDMGMVPIQSGRLGGGNLHAVLKPRRTRLNQGIDDIVLMTYWRNIQAVEVDVRGIEAWVAAVAAGFTLRGWHLHGHFFRILIVILDAIEDFEIQGVSGIDAQGWGFFNLTGRVVLVAVVGVAILIDGMRECESGGKNTILRGNGIGIVDHAALRGTRGTVGRSPTQNRASAEYDCQPAARAHRKVLPEFYSQIPDARKNAGGKYRWRATPHCRDRRTATAALHAASISRLTS